MPQFPPSWSSLLVFSQLRLKLAPKCLILGYPQIFVSVLGTPKITRINAILVEPNVFSLCSFLHRSYVLVHVHVLFAPCHVHIVPRQALTGFIDREKSFVGKDFVGDEIFFQDFHHFFLRIRDILSAPGRRPRTGIRATIEQGPLSAPFVRFLANLTKF